MQLRGFLALGAVLLAADIPASAQQAAGGAAEETAPANLHAASLGERDLLLGDWNGWRSSLEAQGLQINITSVDEVLGNPTGGVRRGAIYEGRLDFGFTLKSPALWEGASLHANAYQIRGRGLSQNDLHGNILVVSNIEAERTTRLFDLWLNQDDLLGGWLSVRLGQLGVDDEFITSQTASGFINSTFGWPALAAADLPSGGPAYPLAAPGLRLTVTPPGTPLSF